MNITGIICEYNPLHLGHGKQLAFLKDRGAVVCLMSGNFVQRGKPAIFDKMVRAQAAVECGADLVLELPVTYALSSAEGFAAGGVQILGRFCDALCFGAETNTPEQLMETAQALGTPAFSQALRAQLELGLSFPKARQAALEQMGLDGSILEKPNNILAVEYCKAIHQQSCAMKPLPILRAGDYHDALVDRENPSATAIRRLMESSKPWEEFVPASAIPCFSGANIHTLEKGERAILARLRTMSDGEFEEMPYGSEGLWRKFMHCARTENTLEEILTAVKSKRYTRTRLDRMALCAFLGITQEQLQAPVPYVRVLAFNDVGREVLKKARETGAFVNIGQQMEGACGDLERRCDALYGLFGTATEKPDPKYRVYYKA